MSQQTGIEWTDATWNPIRGCSRVSEGCRNCYAERVAARFSGEGQAYEGLARMTSAGPRWTGKVRLVLDHLIDPLRWQWSGFDASDTSLPKQKANAAFIAHAREDVPRLLATVKGLRLLLQGVGWNDAAIDMALPAISLETTKR